MKNHHIHIFTSTSSHCLAAFTLVKELGEAIELSVLITIFVFSSSESERSFTTTDILWSQLHRNLLIFPISIAACQCLTMLLLCPLVVPITKVHQWQSTARMSCTYLRTRRFAAPRLPGDTLLTADCGLGFACPFPGKLSHQGHPIVSARVSSCIPHVLPLQKNSIC